MKWLQKKSPEDLRTNKFLNRASSEVNGFAELLQRFERNISILGRSKRTFDNYSRHVAALALHFGKVPTELNPEDIKITFLNFKIDQNPLLSRTLNIPFTDCGFC